MISEVAAGLHEWGSFRPWHTAGGKGGREVRNVDGAPLVVALGGAGPAGLTGLVDFAEDVAALLDARPAARLVICDVAALERPRPADLDQLGRLRLATRRRGCDLVLRNAGLRLRLLLELTGLDEVFACEGSVVGAVEDAGPDP